MEGENGSERENKCKLTPRYEKTPGSRVPREEKPERYKVSYGQTPDVKMGQKLFHLGMESYCNIAGNTTQSEIFLSVLPSSCPPDV